MELALQLMTRRLNGARPSPDSNDSKKKSSDSNMAEAFDGRQPQLMGRGHSFGHCRAGPDLGSEKTRKLRLRLSCPPPRAVRPDFA